MASAIGAFVRTVVALVARAAAAARVADLRGALQDVPVCSPPPAPAP